LQTDKNIERLRCQKIGKLELFMSEFKKANVEIFLGVVRKYMQVRGPLSQKDLAELTDVGVSTMSRFLTMKTSELNPQLIAKIVAKLNVPLHEVIDFVEEDYADKFIRLVKFYKHEPGGEMSGPPMGDEEEDSFDEKPSIFSDDVNTPVGSRDERTASGVRKGAPSESDQIANTLEGTAERATTAKIKIDGKPQSIHFGEETGKRHSDLTFLNLDMEGRDLVVDIGNNLFRYFKHKGFDF
jgi:transcriptional regulator with XRE-family HTH domain